MVSVCCRFREGSTVLNFVCSCESHANYCVSVCLTRLDWQEVCESSEQIAKLKQIKCKCKAQQTDLDIFFWNAKNIGKEKRVSFKLVCRLFHL